jgi:hypothetical protein
MLSRLNISTRYSRRKYLDALFLINVLKIKLVVLPYLILLAYVHPLGELEPSLPSWLTAISRSARQPDVSAANAI